MRNIKGIDQCVKVKEKNREIRIERKGCNVTYKSRRDMEVK